jgi:hypothetical protein
VPRHHRTELRPGVPGAMAHKISIPPTHLRRHLIFTNTTLWRRDDLISVTALTSFVELSQRLIRQRRLTGSREREFFSGVVPGYCADLLFFRSEW